MLYGDLSGTRYGWARPAEHAALLAAEDPGALLAAPAGFPRDRHVMPAASDYWFWLDWYTRRGLGGEYTQMHELRDPLMAYFLTGWPSITFYLGTHCASWLWDGQVDYPLCVSYSRLRRYRQLRRGAVPWIMDSRGFSELAQHGRWTIPLEEYLEFGARADEEIGGLEWMAPQDWMCEPEIIHGGMLGKVRCTGTGLSEREHQRRTVDGFVNAVTMWPRFSSRSCPVIPVLQGRTPEGYLRCFRMYRDAGIDLGEEFPVVGVGSVCRIQSTKKIAAIAAALSPLGMQLHWFGMKTTGLARSEVLRDPCRLTRSGSRSCDSATWSRVAREEHVRLPECTHLSRDGKPNNCSNCVRWAGVWREKLLRGYAAGMSRNEHSPGTLFDIADLYET